MREEDYQVSFEIIATAGDSKGYSMDAICDAREGKFDSANEKINEANKRLLKAHEYGECSRRVGRGNGFTL